MFLIHKKKIVVDGITYKTAEHAFQAAKFDDMEYRKFISEASTPNKAYILGKQKIGGGYKWRTDLNPIIQSALDKGVKIRPDWEDVKVDVMINILRCKFQQDLHCLEVLLATDGQPLVEYSPRDLYWGNGGAKNNGLNMLGQCLMNIRSEFINNTNITTIHLTTMI